MKVKEMIEKLKDMPLTATLKIEVDAYYYEGSETGDVEEPIFNEKDHTVTIGSVCAQP